MTLYDLPDRQLVANSIERYSLGSRDSLGRDADGGLTLWVQSEAPVERDNWLPAPQQGPFTLVLRLYRPSNEVVAHGWAMPQLERVGV